MRAELDKTAEIINLFGVVLNKFAAVEKSPRDFGSGDKLFPSEIHVIEAIGNHPGVNMTELAAELGVSKPAVTQIVGKVARKKLLRRYKSAHNRKEVLVRLTEKGEVAFLGHQSSCQDGCRGRRAVQPAHRPGIRFPHRNLPGYGAVFDQILEERNREVSSDQSPS